ncbi:MAG: hypothetical protein SF069_16435 [Phycisphaerae bacterium]|nr:hypothetical protein [Phycisphaerae bacterium]
MSLQRDILIPLIQTGAALLNPISESWSQNGLVYPGASMVLCAMAFVGGIAPAG